MNRRQILGAVGVGVAGLTTLTTRHAFGHPGDHSHEHDKTHVDCMKACSDCAKACEHGFHHGLLQLAEGKKISAQAVQLLSDCAKFCGLSECMIADHSPVMDHSCQACAEVCQETAEACEHSDNEEIKAAVRFLRECEKSCRAMVQAMKGDHHEAKS